MIGQIQSCFLNITPARETLRPILVGAQVIWALVLRGLGAAAAEEI
jgi:hypothetical protein